jgi:hypothetical protein
MRANYLKTRAKPTPVMSYISYKFRVYTSGVDNVNIRSISFPSTDALLTRNILFSHVLLRALDTETAQQEPSADNSNYFRHLQEITIRMFLRLLYITADSILDTVFFCFEKFWPSFKD